MKKIFQFWLLVALTLGFYSFYAQVPESLTQAYKASIDATKASESIDDKVWMGFRFKEYPVIIFETKERNALAINFSPLPPNFKPIEGTSISYGKIPETEFMANGLRAYSNRLVAFIDSKTLNKYASAKIIEEAFKLFLAYRGFGDQGTFSPGTYPFLDAEANSLSRCENLCLIKAMTSEIQDIKPLLSSFYSFRTKRQASISKEISTVEDSRELIDGLASFAGYLAMSEEQKNSYLSDLMQRLSEYNKGGSNAEKRFRDTGFAVIYLFDKLKFDYKNAIEKSPKNGIISVLKPYIEGVPPKDTSSFINYDEIKSMETTIATEKKAQLDQTLSSIQKAEGLVLVIKIEDILKSTENKLTWSNRYEPEGLTYLDPARIIFSRFFKFSANDFLSLASSRPIFVEIRKSITVGFTKDEIPYITIDEKGVAFAKDSPPQIGLLEVKGVHFEFKVKKARASWDYTTRTLTIEPIYESLP